MIYRIDDDAGARAGAVVRHRAGALRGDDHPAARLPRARALPLHDRRRSASGCCCCRACPGIGSQVNGAYLGVRLGPLTFQPAEFAKIAIIVFLASYLRDTRQLLVIGARRVAGVTIPPLKHFGPLLVVWGAAMVMLVLHPGPRLVADVLRRLPGRALRGHQPLLVRGRRPGALRRRARGSSYHARPTITDRVDAWLHPFGRALRRSRAAATRSRSRSSRRPTAGSSAAASGRRCSKRRAARRCCPRRRPTSSTR